MKWLFSFSGRAGRGEWWKLNIIFWVLAIISGSIDGSMAPADDPSALPIPWVGTLVGLIIFIPSIALNVRRCHDRNKSGWWMLINLIPVIGNIWFFIECGFLPAKEEGNNY